MAFKKATRKNLKARVALIGPAGAGKTASALLIAHGLAPGGRIAVIDSEHGSASKYADEALAGVVVPFDVCELETFAPQTYTKTLHEAEAAGYDVLIVDSLSHAWMGKDGAIEQVDKAAKRSRSGNSFDAWREVTPHHNTLVDAMVACKCHLIVTMRSKTEYVVEQKERNGKTVSVPRKVGLAPIQRDGLEFEFDVVGEIDLDHTYMISKTRCSALDSAVIDKPGVAFGAQLREWLNKGAPEDAGQTPAATKPAATPTPSDTPAPAKQERLPLDVAWNGPHKGTALADLAEPDIAAYADWLLKVIRKATDDAKRAYAVEHLGKINDLRAAVGLEDLKP